MNNKTVIEAELAAIKNEIKGLIPSVRNENMFMSGYERGLRDAMSVISFHEIEARRAMWDRKPHENRKMVDDLGRSE